MDIVPLSSLEEAGEGGGRRRQCLHHIPTQLSYHHEEDGDQEVEQKRGQKEPVEKGTGSWQRWKLTKKRSRNDDETSRRRSRSNDRDCGDQDDEEELYPTCTSKQGIIRRPILLLLVAVVLIGATLAFVVFGSSFYKRTRTKTILPIRTDRIVTIQGQMQQEPSQQELLQFPRVYNMTIMEQRQQLQYNHHDRQHQDDDDKEEQKIIEFTPLLDIIQMKGPSCGRNRNRNNKGRRSRRNFNSKDNKMITNATTATTNETMDTDTTLLQRMRSTTTTATKTGRSRRRRVSATATNVAANSATSTEGSNVDHSSSCHLYFLIHTPNELQFLNMEYTKRFTSSSSGSSAGGGNSDGDGVDSDPFVVEVDGDNDREEAKATTTKDRRRRRTGNGRISAMVYDVDETNRIIRKQQHRHDHMAGTSDSPRRSQSTTAFSSSSSSSPLLRSKKERNHHLSEELRNRDLSSTSQDIRITSYSMMNPLFPCYLSLQGMQDKLEDFVYDSKRLHDGMVNITLETIGESYLRAIDPTGTNGYPIQVLTMTGTRNDVPRDKKGIIMLLSGVHPREYTPPDLIVTWIENMLYYQYDHDADITNMIDRNIIYWIPYLNPDGRQIATSFTGNTGAGNSNINGMLSSPIDTIDTSIDGSPQLWRRKNLNNSTLGSTDAVCNTEHETGVDLNRNYPFLWGMTSGSSNNPCSVIYRGVSPGSEPEVLALVDFALTRAGFPKSQLLRDQIPNPPISYERDESNYVPTPVDELTTKGVFIDLHSYGEHMIWPWGYTNKETPNHDGLEALANKLSYHNGYGMYGPGASYTGSASGASDDWAYAMLGVASMTLELGTDFHESCDYFTNTIVPGNIPALNYATKVSVQPYRLTRGPDIIDVTVSQEHLAFAQDVDKNEGLVTVKVKASDKAHSAIDTFSTNQMIDQIRLYVNIHPHDIGEGLSYQYIPLEPLEKVQSPSGGDTDVAIVSGEVKLKLVDFMPQDGTNRIQYGRQTLYIEAVDTDGYVGPITAKWIELLSGGDDESATPSEQGQMVDEPMPCQDDDVSICNNMQQMQQGGRSSLYSDLYCRIDKVAESCRLTCGNC